MSAVTFEIDASGIATFTVNRPEALNAINAAVMDGLVTAVAAVTGQARAIIVTGAGKAFVAGADIAAMAKLTAEQAAEFARRGHLVSQAFADFEGPIIAAINGYALGGGLELAMACDILVASDKASLGQPEVKLGVVPGFGGSQRLPRRVGPGVAKLLLMTGDTVRADEALRMGIVDKVVPHDMLMVECRKIAEACLANGPQAVAMVKHLVDDGLEMPLDEALELEADTFGDAFSTADQKEGMAAFLAKRRPSFKGL